ncbi:hypothetical protein B0A52_00852 [Exophiala mesophila]|uniref:G-patch domain-containing protein n=1 Tax=Exophiala mesophila TaxID=212818 RepID=A0A438NIF2_EXOME|nr:hypothetical protein B0A52_00852 [Exophiala mesophila]
MGARQRGQMRAKKKPNGSLKGSPWSQKQTNSSLKVHSLDPSIRHRALLADWQDFAQNHPPNSGNSSNSFSMSQEARNTERHTAAWGATRLRDKGINFVSAGNLIRDEIENPPDATKQSSENEHPVPTEGSPAVEPSTEATPPPFEQPTEVAPAISRDDSENEDKPARRDSILSQSSEEIVFKGRMNGGEKPSRSLGAPVASPLPTTSPTAKQPSVDSPSPSPLPSPAPESTDPNPDPYANIYSTERKRFDRRGRPMRQTSDSKEERLIMEDYIANMNLEDGDDEGDDAEERGEPRRGNEHYRFFDGSAKANVKVQTRLRSPPPTKGNVHQAIDWNSTDLEDFDEFSTTDEDVAEVSQVLRRRERPSGVQYLVTGIGQGASDAKWVLGERLKTPSAIEEIRIYKEIQAMKVLESTEDTSDTSDGDEDDDEDDEALDDLVNDIDSEDDENQRIFKRTARMTDEQIARALAKQEELGMGADEVLLFDGQTDEPDDFDSPPNFIPFSTSNHLSNRTKSKRNRRRNDHFPPAEAFADALEQDPYGAFDIMDFDRPSLRPKKKGRKADLPFELGVEDDDLAELLRTQWHKDREKKASRRREKQAEREAALFEAGERNRPDAIKAEIRRFLVSEAQSLELAPMDTELRASVHRLAKSLKLKSRSQGKDGQGIGRFPVLTKTSSTRYYTIDTIWEIDNLMNLRKFLPRGQGGSYRGPGAANIPAVARIRRVGGGVTSGATYMNGDIVGASAPEIGAENKGRAMLEKMGWTSGMGIGAIGNKGGIDVIKHVVKTTKAGLG